MGFLNGMAVQLGQGDHKGMIIRTTIFEPRAVAGRRRGGS